MRSRWVKQSIIVGLFMFAFIMLVVVMSNWSTIKRKFGGRAYPVEQAATDPAATGGQIGSNLEGFLEDDDFFDKKQYESDIKIETGQKVSMMLDSVSQDLRITIINAYGAPATGTKFIAEIEGVGAYTDDDADGIIYVDHLREGQYFVSLKQMEGVIVPATKTMINISQKLEYKALSDVAYLILSEDDVDITADDTSEKLAIDEADGTENYELDSYKSKGKVGIDVSRYNKIIDWKAVKNDGIDYAIIRCGYRGATSGSLIRDSYFKENMMGAIKAGVPVGVYFFSQAITEAEAIEEASMVIEECKLYMLDYPIFIDSESAGGSGRADGLDIEQRTRITKAFCETIANSGYEAGVYASKNWWNNKLDAEGLTQYHAWLAQYTEEPDYEGFYDYWQYTSKGTVDGIDTKVDLNIAINN